jgi:hypothetical protein
MNDNIKGASFTRSFDARVWAKNFMHINKDNLEGIDEDLMITWFANALMRGFDEAEERKVLR